jgi:hypothetical protein
MGGKYRFRTWMRGHLPNALLWLAPKGMKDCGNHEWYRHDAMSAACYHCVVGWRRVAPSEVIRPFPAPSRGGGKR